VNLINLKLTLATRITLNHRGKSSYVVTSVCHIALHRAILENITLKSKTVSYYRVVLLYLLFYTISMQIHVNDVLVINISSFTCYDITFIILLIYFFVTLDFCQHRNHDQIDIIKNISSQYPININ
jgi:hypothetical protein